MKKTTDALLNPQQKSILERIQGDSLDLSTFQPTARDILEVEEFLFSQYPITKLKASHLPNPTMVRLLKTLQGNKTVTTLNLSHNEIGINLIDYLYKDFQPFNLKAFSHLTTDNSIINTILNTLSAIIESQNENSIKLKQEINKHLGELSVCLNPYARLKFREILNTIRNAVEIDEYLDGFNLEYKGRTVSLNELAFLLQNNQTIKTLILSNNLLNCEDTSLLFMALKNNSTVTELHLNGNRLNEKSASELSCYLKTNKSLKTLNVENNIFYKEGGIAIALSLIGNKTLTSLRLGDEDNEKLDPEVILAFSDLISKNTTLRHLALRGLIWDTEALFTFLASLKQNKTILNIEVTGPKLMQEVETEIKMLCNRNQKSLPKNNTSQWGMFCFIYRFLGTNQIPKMPHIDSKGKSPEFVQMVLNFMGTTDQLQPDKVQELWTKIAAWIHKTGYPSLLAGSSSDSAKATIPHTLADGNCAFNAAVLGIFQLINLKKVRDFPKLYELISKQLNLQTTTLEALAHWLNHLDNASFISLQQKISPLFRKLAVNYIMSNYAYYQDTYENGLKAAFVLYQQNQRDDTYCVHAHILTQFRELLNKRQDLNKDNKEIKDVLELDTNINHELIQWWQGKGRVDYFNKLKESAISAEDTGSWGSEVEIDAIANIFAVTIENLGREGCIQILGCGKGIVKNLSPEEIRHLSALSIGSSYHGDFRIEIKSKRDLENIIHHPRLSESERKFLDEQGIRETLEYNNNAKLCSRYPQIEALSKKLIDIGAIYYKTKKGVDSCITDFVSPQRLSFLIKPVPDTLKAKVLQAFQADLPSFTIRNFGNHWTYEHMHTAENDAKSSGKRKCTF